jgi:hypothetical protein
MADARVSVERIVHARGPRGPHRASSPRRRLRRNTGEQRSGAHDATTHGMPVLARTPTAANQPFAATFRSCETNGEGGAHRHHARYFA